MKNRTVVASLAELLPVPSNDWERNLALVPQPVRRDGPSPLRKALKRTNEAASIALLIVLCIFWAMFLRPQSLGGSAGYVLVSGKSMLPLYHTGDLVLVEHQSSYHVGEVIAYRVPKGDVAAGAQVIHRIVGGDAKHGWVVQGDNRSAPDVWRPKQGDIVGAKAVRFPSAAVVLGFLRSPLLLGILAASFVFVHVFLRGKPEGELESTHPRS